MKWNRQREGKQMSKENIMHKKKTKVNLFFYFPHICRKKVTKTKNQEKREKELCNLSLSKSFCSSFDLFWHIIAFWLTFALLLFLFFFKVQSIGIYIRRLLQKLWEMRNYVYFTDLFNIQTGSFMNLWVIWIFTDEWIVELHLMFFFSCSVDRVRNMSIKLNVFDIDYGRCDFVLGTSRFPHHFDFYINASVE